jgi:hypothetical protein
MASSTADVTNWMHLFRWIVKMIRDEYGLDEKILTRTAELENDLGLSLEQIERMLEWLQEGFAIRFPEGVLDEVIRLEELCLLASWLKGLYKQPPFLGEPFVVACRALNPAAG